MEAKLKFWIIRASLYGDISLAHPDGFPTQPEAQGIADVLRSNDPDDALIVVEAETGYAAEVAYAEQLLKRMRGKEKTNG
jgi:hypothetical protein